MDASAPAPQPFQLGTSMILPEETEVWNQWQCPTVDNELQQLGSPLLTVPTPGRKAARGDGRRESHASTLTNHSLLPAQHVRVVVRVRLPNPFELTSCLEVQQPDAIRIAPPEERRLPLTG